jgi:uncharacterized protein (DUF58 family)
MALIEPRRDQRLGAYLALGLTALAGSLATGRPELAALAAPSLVVLALGLRQRGDLRLSGDVEVAEAQVIEGDEVDGVVRITCASDLELEVWLEAGSGVEPLEPRPVLAWHRSVREGSVELPFRVRAGNWGHLDIGQLRVRARIPFGLLHWDGVAAQGPRLNVLPAPSRLKTMLDPAAVHASSGMHVSRYVGHGQEFTEIRTYEPGDRLRDLNWRATARQRKPLVNRHHPERSGEVVVLVDTFLDDRGGSSLLGQQALARCARAAWSVAQVHLAAQDRVGFLAFGRVGGWLPPGGGDRARYALLETLLAVGGTIAKGELSWGRTPERVVPPAALVVGFSPLWDRRLVSTLQALRSRGRAVGCVVIDTDDLLDPDDDPDVHLARRLWKAEIDQRRQELVAAGVPAVPWTEGGSIAGVIAAMARQKHAPVGPGVPS